MAGRPGTARFGVNPEIHEGKTNDSGISKVGLPIDGPWTETHFMYNPGQVSRDMGSTRGSDPQEKWIQVPRQSDYFCNHDGYIGGDVHLMNLDERKVFETGLYSIDCEYAEDSPNGYAPSQTTGAFD